MGVFTRKFVDAWTGNGPRGRACRAQAPQNRAAEKTATSRGLATSLILLLFAAPAAAETIRIATWHVELSRRGPGLLLRDIERNTVEVRAVVNTIAHLRPDVILLSGFDWDASGAALGAFSMALDDAGHALPFRIAEEPNSGLQTKLDLDGDGRLGGPRDAQGYGRFHGAGGMALLSNIPITGFVDHSAVLWKDQPGAELPMVDGKIFPSADVYEIQRLSSVAHWQIKLANELTLLAFAAGPPVFDGPEDRNGLRNAAEILFWENVPPNIQGHVVILGYANLDPIDGEGRHKAISKLLAHPNLRDPEPQSVGAVEAAELEGTAEIHQGDPALDTVDWRHDPGPGNLRVSYVLPGSNLSIMETGVFWPDTNSPEAEYLKDAPRHRMVWVDLAVP